jgi:hypothetical protein
MPLARETLYASEPATWYARAASLASPQFVRSPASLLARHIDEGGKRGSPGMLASRMTESGAERTLVVRKRQICRQGSSKGNLESEIGSLDAFPGSRIHRDLSNRSARRRGPTRIGCLAEVGHPLTEVRLDTADGRHSSLGQRDR